MPGRSFTVTIPGIPPGGNELHRMTHWQVRDSRRDWRTRTVAVVGPIEPDQFPDGWQPINRCRVTVTWMFHVKRKRDFDNLFAGLKPIIDGLVESRLIAGDDTEAIRELRGECWQPADADCIRLEIEEMAS